MESVSFAEMALADLIDAFSSTEAVPGGGSAAALAGAVGASLLLMVSGMTKTRTGVPEETADLADAAARIRPLRDALVDLVDRDSDAYRKVMQALALPKGSEDEKARRASTIEAASQEAAEVPLDTMRACQQVLRGAVIVAANCSRRTTSDVGVAIELLLAGLRGARMNVEINLSGLHNPEASKNLSTEAAILEADALADSETARRQLAPS